MNNMMTERKRYGKCFNWLRRLGVCFSFILFTCLLFAGDKKVQPVRDLIGRVLKTDKDLPVSLSLKKGDKGDPYYTIRVQDGILKIEGNTPVALTRGFYNYLKNEGCGVYTWSGNNLRLPDVMQDRDLQKVVSPFENHYYFNVCTYGYSMPYWDWNRWEQEIDWMALHGIDMPLALVAYEAIIARVWKKMGLTDEEINGYFIGPAHLPWLRMGCISGVDGPLNDDWHRGQIELQHRILKRMRELGMKPICPGFPGFIPQAFKRIHPELEIIETHWGGAFRNWMVSPQEPLFKEIGTAFIREWEKEFGKCDYYLVDSFNELEIPFPEKGNPKRYEMAASYGQKVYESIKAANPRAVWTMQGWMFGYQRYIWDYETLGALVSKVPDDKMLLLDLAVDYNKHFWHSEVNWEYYKGFYNKPWVYSVIPNMGGKVGMTGVLDFYANGHLEALSSVNRGKLVAHGLAPEGIENNEVLYELVTDAGWSNQQIDVKGWLRNYSKNRYGKVPEVLMEAWEHLLKSVYGTFTDHPRFNWQFRPGNVKNGSIYLCDDYFKGLECFIAAADELKDSPLYRVDLSEMASHYLGGKAEILIKQIDQEYLLGDTLQARFLQSRFETLLLGIDALLSQHPTLRLDRWLDFAEKAAVTPEQRKQYEINARRIVTIWGPPVDDYSARIWSGLVGQYYLGRWKQYFSSRNSGQPINMAAWERAWVEENKDVDYGKSSIDVVSFSRELLELSKHISSKDLKLNRKNMIGTWHVGAEEAKELTLTISAQLLKKMKGISLEQIRGNGKVLVSEYILEADGKVIASSDQKVQVDLKNPAMFQINLPSEVNANNGCVLKIRICSLTTNAAGMILLR